jgi:hypothetical protein
MKQTLDSHHFASQNSDEDAATTEYKSKKTAQTIEQTMQEMNKRYAQNMKNIAAKMQENKIKSFIAGV